LLCIPEKIEHQGDDGAELTIDFLDTLIGHASKAVIGQMKAIECAKVVFRAATA
jgi:hypothetical protein